jgi:hemerythrin
MSQLPAWSDSLLLGHHTIDQQHKQLIELCNRVADFAFGIIEFQSLNKND